MALNLSNKGQVFLEALVTSSVLLIFIQLLLALSFWIFVRWGAQVAIYEYLLCRDSIAIEKPKRNCKFDFEKSLKNNSFGLIHFSYINQDSPSSIGTKLEMKGPFQIQWKIADSIKIQLVKYD